MPKTFLGRKLLYKLNIILMLQEIQKKFMSWTLGGRVLLWEGQGYGFSQDKIGYTAVTNTL